MISQEAVLEKLSLVQDPDLNKDIVALGMVEDVKINDNEIHFTVNLTTPACPLKEQIKQDCIDKVQQLGDVKVFPNMSSKVTSMRKAGPVLPGVKNIVAVASGKGGVGKSTVALNLALALQSTGAKVGLVDADIYGPSVPTMLGLTNAKPGIEKRDDKSWILPVDYQGMKVLSIGFLVESAQAVVWRGPMASSAIRQFVTDTIWGELDYLIFDLPPGTGDIHLTLVQTVPLTGAVIVTTPQEVALADARKAVAMFKMENINVPVLGLIENMAWFTPKELPENKYFIFGKDGGKAFAESNALPLLGQIPLVQEIREAGDLGKPISKQFELAESSYFLELAKETARQIAIRNEERAPTEIVEIKR